MKLFRPQFRLFFCCFIIITFFLPSYRWYSAFEFIMLAYSEIGKRNGLNSTDAFVATTPLILIPVMAAIILIRSFLKLPSRQILVMLPFLLLLFFLTIIIDSEVKEVTGLSGFAFFPETQIGFYLMLLASLLLPFTKNYRGKRTRKWRTPETEIAV